MQRNARTGPSATLARAHTFVLLVAALAMGGCEAGQLASTGAGADDGVPWQTIESVGRDGPGRGDRGTVDPGEDTPGGGGGGAPDVERYLEITAPTDGELLSRTSVLVEGIAENVDRVAVNGTVVEVIDETFELRLTLPEGENLIEVVAADADPASVTVTVDASPPVLLTDYPSRGSFVHESVGALIQVEGRWEEPYSTVTSITVNGLDAEVREDGTWRFPYAPVFGMNQLEIVAEDAAGHTSRDTRALLYGTYSPRDALTDEALAVFLRADAFDVIERIAIPLMEAEMAGALSSFGGGGDIEIRRIEYSRIGLDLQPSDGYIRSNVRVFNLRVHVRVRFKVLFIRITINGSVSANPAEIDAQIVPTISPAGVLGIQLNRGRISLHDFRFDISGIPGFIESLLRGLVRDIAEDVLNDVLSEVVLEDLFDPSTLLRTLELFGYTLEFDFKVRSIPITPAGVTMLADAAVNAPGATARGPGPLYLNEKISEIPGRKMLNIAVAFNLANRLFYSLWEAGALDLDIAELLGDTSESPLPIDLNVAAFSLFVDPVLSDLYPTDSPIKMRLRPLLPPFARPPTEDEAEGDMIVQVGDMLIDFYAEPEPGVEERWATISLSTEIAVTLAWEDGALVPELALRSVVDVEDEPVFDFEDGRFETLMEGLLDAIPGFVSEGLDEFGLGEIMPGLTLTETEIRVLESLPYIMLESNLAAP